ncbi:MAG: hypothetical protein V1816_18770 [Pseudomonadota bacterium]
MEQRNNQSIAPPKTKIMAADGKIYFDKKSERNVFFVLTLAMLLWGILTKVGLL